MKAILFLIILLSCANNFAQSNVDISPYKPANCKTGKYKSLNYIMNTKTSETAQTLEVSFTTFYGKCLNRRFKIQNNSRYFGINIFKERINTPWSYVPTYTFERLNDKMRKVTITINKSIAFAKRNKRYFTLMIYPSNKRSESFRWILNAKYNREQDQTKVTLTK